MTPETLTEPKIDFHCHVLDPARFPYTPGVAYEPDGGEIGPVEALMATMDAYGIDHSVVVGPNSGYGPDNACLLDAIARAPRRLTGVAVTRPDASRDELEDLRGRGVAGVALNPTVLGLDHYAGSDAFFSRVADAGMALNVQVEHDMLDHLGPRLLESGAPVLVDHHGRPTVPEGPDQPGFSTLLRMADSGRVWVKLSGMGKFSVSGPPFEDTDVFTRELVSSFGPERCLWASDWPYLRAGQRLDIGVLLGALERSVPVAADRTAILWDTPLALLASLGSAVGRP